MLPLFEDVDDDCVASLSSVRDGDASNSSDAAEAVEEVVKGWLEAAVEAVVEPEPESKVTPVGDAVLAVDILDSDDDDVIISLAPIPLPVGAKKEGNRDCCLPALLALEKDDEVV